MSNEEKNKMESQEETYQSILGDEIPLDDDTVEPTETEEENGSEKKPKASKKKILTIAGVSAASVALVGCLTFAGIGIFNKNVSKNAVSSPNYTLDSKIAACYYHDVVQMFVDSYGEEMLLNYYGMDVSKSLKNQESPAGDGSSWFDLIMEQTQGTLEQQLIMYEAANSAGFEMPEAEKQLIAEALENADVASYGNGVTEEDIRKALEIQALSTSYYNHIMKTFEASDEEIETYFEANGKNFMTCGLAGFSVSYDTGDGSTTMTQEKAKELTDKLSAADDAKEFEEIVADILLTYEGYTQEELDANLPSIYNDAYTYTANNELAEWAFGGAKTGETYTLEGTGSYYVYILTREPERNETSTVNVRHILFMETEDNMAAAEDALAEWESGDATEESFAALAEQYSEDGGSNTNGGLYEGVYPGQMVQTFNDWCFDESRKPGDTGIVETEYGVHIMYFSSDSGPMWKAQISSTLAQQAYNEWFTEQVALYPITFNTDALNSIDG